MKKFIKRRRGSKERTVDFRIGSPYMENSSGIESDFVDYADPQAEIEGARSTAPTIVENQKLKASIRRLIQENTMLKEELENRALLQTYEDAEVTEIRSLAAKLVKENEQLESQLALSRNHAKTVERSLEEELESITEKLDGIEEYKDQSDQQFWKLFLEHETLRKSMKEQEEAMNGYISLKDHKATMEGLRKLLGQLRQQYHSQTKALHLQLKASEQERRKLSSELSSMRASQEQKHLQNKELSHRVTSLATENKKLVRDVKKFKDETASLQRALDDLLGLAERNVQDNAAYKELVQEELGKMNDQLQNVNFTS